MIRYLMHDQLTIDERPAPRCLILFVYLVVVHTAHGLAIIGVKRNCWVFEVILGQVYLVVYDLRWSIDTHH